MNDGERVPDVLSDPIAATELEAVRIFQSTALIDVPSGRLSASCTSPMFGSFAARSFVQAAHASSAPSRTDVPRPRSRRASCRLFMPRTLASRGAVLIGEDWRG